MNLILASKSPRRIALLKELGFTFDIIPSQNPETSTKKRPAARQAAGFLCLWRGEKWEMILSEGNTTFTFRIFRFHIVL